MPSKSDQLSVTRARRRKRRKRASRIPFGGSSQPNHHHLLVTNTTPGPPNNTKTTTRSRPSDVRRKKTHLLLLHPGLAVKVVRVEAEVSWHAAGPLEHLYDGDGRDGLERAHPQQDLRHRPRRHGRVVRGNRRHLNHRKQTPAEKYTHTHQRERGKQ